MCLFYLEPLQLFLREEEGSKSRATLDNDALMLKLLASFSLLLDLFPRHVFFVLSYFVLQTNLTGEIKKWARRTPYEYSAEGQRCCHSQVHLISGSQFITSWSISWTVVTRCTHTHTHTCDTWCHQLTNANKMNFLAEALKLAVAVAEAHFVCFSRPGRLEYMFGCTDQLS